MVLYLFLSIVLSFNQEVVHPNDFQEEYLLPITALPLYIDTTNQATFEDILHGAKFIVYPNFKPKDYCIECTYWIKVSIDLDSHDHEQWMLEFYDQTIDSITAYIPEKYGEFRSDQVGDYFPFANKSFAHKNFEWLIDADALKNHEAYFRIKSHSYADIRIALRTVNRFVFYSLNEYFLYGIFYGMIFIVAVYNMLMYFAIKERKYVYYTCYILSVFVYAMCVDGIAYQYLWPTSPHWNQIAFGTALFSLIFWALLFTKRFLNTRTKAPVLDKILFLTIVIRSLFFLYALFFDHDLFEFRNIEIIPLTLIFYTSIVVWLRGYQPARFFVLAQGMLFFGFLFKALLYLSIIPFSIMTYYSLHVSFILEMLFLTFALSDRIRILKSNRDKALKRTILQQQENAQLKDKVNKELEEKIHKRTEQIEKKNLLLAESNQKLIEQTNEINRINSKLDLDNWKLQNSIKEVLQDRLINKNLTYSEFNEIFPNELTCFKFLDKLKWHPTYECAKCGNQKYLDGRCKFSRRCTKCGYDESISSNTVFHGIKFPLEKAFYILYVTSSGNKEFTLDELSEILDLRRNTVWNFKKKVEDFLSSDISKSHSIMIQNLFSIHLS